jgi:hypothetical protein
MTPMRVRPKRFIGREKTKLSDVVLSPLSAKTRLRPGGRDIFAVAFSRTRPLSEVSRIPRNAKASAVIGPEFNCSKVIKTGCGAGAVGATEGVGAGVAGRIGGTFVCRWKFQVPLPVTPLL